jgi:type IV secretory pathway component VirB8
VNETQSQTGNRLNIKIVFILAGIIVVGVVVLAIIIARSYPIKMY